MSEKTFRKSDSIAALAQAFVKAQAKIKPAIKDEANPFFKTKYADLASVWDACRDALAENGLGILQFPRETEKGVEVETVLIHSSGEFLAESLALPVVKHDAQGFGSAITYARRYGLAAICGVAPEDDDGNAATESMKSKPKSEPRQERRQEPTPQPPKNGKPSGTDFGKRLRARLDKKEAELVKQGLCRPGDLITYVAVNGIKRYKFQGEIFTWTETFRDDNGHELSLAEAVKSLVDDFEDERKQAGAA